MRAEDSVMVCKTDETIGGLWEVTLYVSIMFVSPVHPEIYLDPLPSIIDSEV